MIRPINEFSNTLLSANAMGTHGANILENRLIFSCVLVMFLVLMGVLIYLLLNIKSKRKQQKALIAENENLEKQCLNLQEQLNETQAKNDEMKEQYEELQKAQSHIKQLAYNDSLTQLPNRISFTEMLDNVLYTLRQEETVAVMNIDIDDFKVINDTLGHSYGDELLIDVTHRLKQALTEDDYLARIGGDEFILLSQNIMNISQYEDKIKKVMKVFSYPFVLSTKEFFVTVSIGIALAPNDGKTSQVIIKNVDTATYAAKDRGKDRYCYFDASMNEKLMNKIEMQSELRKAIENKEFVAYYQPQIQLQDNKLVGFEALIRWKQEDGTLVPPIDFIPLAEETGLIVPIGQYILIEACREIKLWNDKGYKDLTMAVNLSARQFRDRDFVQMLTDIIDEVGVNPKNLELEITETLALEDMEYTVATIKKLQELGIKFSLDDFGTGYSSMHYLKSLPIDILKIDKSFLATLLEDESEQKIVKTIINMAQILELEVIAEGVESEEQAEYLKQMNCDMAQGFLYSRPVPSNEAYELIKQYHQI